MFRRGNRQDSAYFLFEVWYFGVGRGVFLIDGGGFSNRNGGFRVEAGWFWGLTGWFFGVETVVFECGLDAKRGRPQRRRIDGATGDLSRGRVILTEKTDVILRCVSISCKGFMWAHEIKPTVPFPNRIHTNTA